MSVIGSLADLNTFEAYFKPQKCFFHIKNKF